MVKAKNINIIIIITNILIMALNLPVHLKPHCGKFHRFLFVFLFLCNFYALLYKLTLLVADKCFPQQSSVHSLLSRKLL